MTKATEATETQPVSRWLERAKDVTAVISPILLSVVAWCFLELISHSNRIAVLERGEQETRRQFEQMDKTLNRIDEKLDRFVK